MKREIREILESQTFRQAPKLGTLLQYVCNKALLEETERISEYTIAVDVFGKPENFKESKDSNVRVEVHRLRKRLAQFYEKEGAGRALRIVIPPGRYAPEFLLTETQAADAAVEVEEAIAPLPPPEPEVAAPAPAVKARKPNWVFALAAALAVAVVSLAIFWGRHEMNATASASTQAKLADASTRRALGGPGLPVPVRILAGYSGPPRTDGARNVWGPDRYVEGGRPGSRTSARVARTNNPLLFESSRIGDFVYKIPLAPGVYELHLYFVENEFIPEVGRGENDRTFFFHINDLRVMPSFDIESDAMGANIAHERVFKDVQPQADGLLHLSVESSTGVPTINAIEVLPGLPRKQLPVRLVAQPVPFTDHFGDVWQSDNYSMNGQPCQRNLPVAGTLDSGLYAMERYGHFTYAIPADVHGRYGITLHFAELYFGPDLPGGGGVGSRVFKVMCNGVLLADNLDIFREVGSAHALVKEFHNLKPSAQGKLNLTFEPVVNYAVVSAIEVIDESP